MRAVMAVAMLASPAWAETALDQDRALDLVPDPASPTLELGYRTGLRGEAGARVPILRAEDRTGFELDLPAFIELHNDHPGPVPYQLWRGHIGVLASERWRAGNWMLRAFGVLEHESDHDIDHHWIYWEGAGVGLDATQDVGDIRVTIAGEARLLFETCTIDIDCTTHAPLGTGDTSVEGIVAFVAELDPGAAHHWFAAIYADATVPRPLIAGDRRVLAHVGYAIARGSLGNWQLFGAFLAGPEVGLDRVNGTQLAIGGGVRWQP